MTSLTLKEYTIILGALAINGVDEENDKLIEKIKSIIQELKSCKQNLYKFYWDCGRMGDIEGLFKATPEEITEIMGKRVYFGEVLGKHSEIYGIIEEGDIILQSDDPSIVLAAIESGFNPIETWRRNEEEEG